MKTKTEVNESWRKIAEDIREKYINSMIAIRKYYSNPEAPEWQGIHYCKGCVHYCNGCVGKPEEVKKCAATLLNYATKECERLGF